MLWTSWTPCKLEGLQVGVKRSRWRLAPVRVLELNRGWITTLNENEFHCGALTPNEFWASGTSWIHSKTVEGRCGAFCDRFLAFWHFDHVQRILYSAKSSNVNQKLLTLKTRLVWTHHCSPLTRLRADSICNGWGDVPVCYGKEVARRKRTKLSTLLPVSLHLNPEE